MRARTGRTPAAAHPSEGAAFPAGTSVELELPGDLRADNGRRVRLSGWGLLLVKRTADGWGSDGDGALWFEVAPPRPRLFERPADA